jgi:hypothetical protein
MLGSDRVEYELVMRQSVEADISRMRKMLDDTNVIRLHLESDIESLKEELITLRKYHKAVRKYTQYKDSILMLLNITPSSSQTFSDILQKPSVDQNKIPKILLKFYFKG